MFKKVLASDFGLFILFKLFCFKKDIGFNLFCRSSVVGCFANEIAFLENEGLFLLLDLLEVGIQ